MASNHNIPSRPLLDSIRTPADLQKLPAEQLPQLAAELRAELIAVVSRTGGHLASNLGVVELTIALLRVFNPPADTVIWDTGHQGYVYKLLTGRRQLFQNLRDEDGCCGFPARAESPYDAFGTGHAGTAISAALGFAAARDRQGGSNRVLAIVGDGALGCGSSLEGLNSIIETTHDFILIINDNKMSIAPNVGALARHLNRVISGERYNRFKHRVRSMIDRIPKVGYPLHRWIHRGLEALKSILLPGVIFEKLGLRYIGPVDGHSLDELLNTFAAARRLREPLVIHVLTEKGHGYPQAIEAPELFHGLSRKEPVPAASLPVEDTAGTIPAESTFSDCLGECLVKMVEQDRKILAISAGMCHATGLGRIRERFPQNLLDVGITEEHAVIFAAGLAAAGMKPVVAIYASFMQRAVDYVFHDVCLQRLPVIFCLDRAGVVEDGPTHHGIYDLAFWRALPGLAILQPADGAEFEQMLKLLLGENRAPAIIRYPRGQATALPVLNRQPLTWGRAEVLREGRDVAIWASGRETALALELAADLAASGIEALVVNPRFLCPFDVGLLREHAARMPVVTLENHVIPGGLASLAAETLAGQAQVRLLHRGWPNSILPWGTEQNLREKFRLDRASLAEDIRQFVTETRKS